MSREITFGSIEQYPGERTKWPKASPFRANYSQTVQKLDDELWQAGAVMSTVVVQLDVGRSDFLADGSRLRANARPRTAAVVLSFTSTKLGKLRFACDRFNSWHDNLRAIALGMESLRRVDRYGITSDGQQYAGFRALEAAESARGFESIEQAARFLVRHAANDPSPEESWVDGAAALVLDDAELLDHYFRRAMKLHHPDAGGDAVVAALLNTARSMVEEHAK